jgi:hypothetical protein
MSFEYKLNNLFLESFGGFDNLTEDQIRKNIEKEASDFSPQQKIYHHIPNDELPNADVKFLVYEPNKAEEKTQTYYELIMDNLKAWNNFPPRKNSIVANTSKTFAVKNSTSFLVIPINGTEIGVCPKERLINSFSYVSINLGIKFNTFNRSLNVLLNIFNNSEGTYDSETKKLVLTNEKEYNSTYSEFYKAMKVVDEKFDQSNELLSQIKDHPHNKETEDVVISLIEYLLAKKIKLSALFDKLFKPSENNFKLMSFKNLIIGENKNKEVWLNSKCFLIRETEFIKIVGD